MSFFERKSKEVLEYFNILCNGDIPSFLEDYIETKEMQKQDKISVTCGTIYSKMFDQKWYSSLDHSVAVALIIWNFTHDKKQTLSGLFHDISTPVFKHSIDFLNGDAKIQESTELNTSDIIKNSKEIMGLLKRDNISLSEVDNYHLYPISDNISPKLSSDRLEYTLSNSLGVVKEISSLDEIEKIYKDISVGKNEDGEDELVFNNIDTANRFVEIMSILSSTYINPKTKFSMQFIADVLKVMIEENIISISDLYNKSDKEIIDIIKSCTKYNISKSFDIWQNSKDVYESDNECFERYSVNVDPKIRYIDPLVKNGDNYERLSEFSKEANNNIERAKKYKTKKYIYSNFKF